MAFANLYWNCIDQQLKDTELEDEREELSSIHIPKSQASPVFNNAKLSFLTFLTSMFESKVEPPTGEVLSDKCTGTHSRLAHWKKRAVAGLEFTSDEGYEGGMEGRRSASLHALNWALVVQVLYASPSNRTLPKTPRDFYMPNYEDLEIITKDKKVVHGWLIKRKDSRNVPTIIHFHGNACNVSHMLYDALGMFQKVKTNIMLVDYRGYGLSEGSPTQAGLIMDAEAALDYLLRRRDVVDPTSIFLFGRSLGGAVAIELAARRESAVRAVMVENTFTSIDDLVKHLSPAYSKHVIRAMSNKWNSQQVISSISRPMLFLSGRADEIVPPWMMTSLYKAAVRSEGRELAAFPKGKHNSTCLSRGYYETIKRFLDRVLVPGVEEGAGGELGEAGEAAR